MDEPNPTQARQIARAVTGFEREWMGRSPKSLVVLLGGDTLVITLHETLSPAEQVLARLPEGQELVRQFHESLFTRASEPLRQEIERILGLTINSATAEIQGLAGTVVLVFLLGASVATESWSGPAPCE